MTTPAHVLAAVRSIPHPRKEPPMTMPTRDRYAQCDNTCTVDCGACKGAGRPVIPPPNPLLMATVDGNPVVPLAAAGRPVTAPAPHPGPDVAGAGPAADGELREQIARWLCARRNGESGWDHVPGRRYWLDDADALLTGPLAALVAERDQTQGAIAHIPWEDEHTPYRYRETGDAFCRVCAHGWPCSEAAS